VAANRPHLRRTRRSAPAAYPADVRAGGRLNVGQIVAASTLSRTAVAHHLRVLQEAGVLKREKAGREVYFWPDVTAVHAALAAVQDYLAEHR